MMEQYSKEVNDSKIISPELSKSQSQKSHEELILNS